MWEGLGRTFAEAFFLREIVAEGSRRPATTVGALDAWLRLAPAGKVACSAHLANWELAVAPALPHRSGKLWSIYQRLKNPLVDEAVSQAMRGFPLRAAGSWPRHEGVPRQLPPHRAGWWRTVATCWRICETSPASRSRSWAALPRPRRSRLSWPSARGSPDPGLLHASSSGMSGFSQELPRSSRMPDSGDRKADIATVTTAIQAVLGTATSEDWPDQWMWAHRRWAATGPSAASFPLSTRRTFVHRPSGEELRAAQTERLHEAERLHVVERRYAPPCRVDPPAALPRR